jgi:hypothetical protein
MLFANMYWQHQQQDNNSDLDSTSMKGTGVGGMVGGVPFNGLEGIPSLRNNVRVCSDAAKAKTECRYTFFVLLAYIIATL